MENLLMCSPNYYDVTYSINPWMHPELEVDRTLASEQWQNLVELIKNFLGLKVEVLTQRQGLPDMVFSADQGIIFDKTFIQANFRYPQRREEAKLYASWFKKRGYKIIHLPQKIKFEGGDFLFWNDKILAGFGFRTDKASHKEIAKITGKKVISLELIDPFLYHLDMTVFPIDDQNLIYYPGAFSKETRKLIEKEAKSTVKATRKDTLNFALNALVHKKKIITAKGLNGLLSDLIAKGFKIVESDVSEFKKAGGGVHCLIFSI